MIMPNMATRSKAEQTPLLERNYEKSIGKMAHVILKMRKKDDRDSAKD